MDMHIMKVGVRYEQDIVLARQRARQIAREIGLDTVTQARISTSVSEIARNAFQYAGGGEVELLLRGDDNSQALVIVIRDQGPGIAHLKEILDNRFTSRTGMGRGLLGARRLMDDLRVETGPGQGTVVTMLKTLPAKLPAVTAEMVAGIAEKLQKAQPENPFAEIQQQNQELLQAYQQLKMKQEELERLNQELEDTNRGVLALYAEIDERSTRVRLDSEIRARFFSGMSHELRTPINSILSLSRLLLDRADGDLTKEQERQVFYIKAASESLSGLINDLLDISRFQAGKITPHISEFTVEQVFSTLKGMIRPLLGNSSVNLVFAESAGLPVLRTDEGKISQVLRNLAANAVKFTEAGEVRIAAGPGPERGTICFSVADTGIGIAPEDLDRIFEEYVQLPTTLPEKMRGSGLGLALSRKLVEFLGGTISVESTVGSGSKFSFQIPVDFSDKEPEEAEKTGTVAVDSTRNQVLVVEDDPATMLLYESYFKGTGFEIIQARTIGQARELLAMARPSAIVLDIILEKELTWDFLRSLKEDPETSMIPVIIVSVLEEKEKGLSLGADDYCTKPVERGWLLNRLSTMAETGREKILVIDDEEVARYILRSHLANTKYRVIEAATGEEGIRLAREEQPDIIFLDLIMPGMSGSATLDRLKSLPSTRDIPVVVNTAKKLSAEERALLGKNTEDIILKKSSSREKSIARVRAALVKISGKRG